MAAKKPSAKASAVNSDATKEVAHSFIKQDHKQIDVQPILKRIARPLAAGIGDAIEALGTVKLLVKAEDIRTETCEAWYNIPDQAAAYGLFQIAPLQGAAAVRLGGSLITVLVDMFFGGALSKPTRKVSDFSSTDMRLIQRVTNGLEEQMAKSWAAQGPFRCSLAGISCDADEGHIAPSNSNLVIQPFTLLYDGGISFVIEIAYPLDMVQAAKEMAVPLQAPAEAHAVDPEWRRNMASALEHVHLPVRSVLACSSMTLPELARLKVGDIIPIPPARNLPLLIGDKIFARGGMGEQIGMTAFRIDQIEKG